MYLLGYDIGSSKIKVALIRADNFQVIGVIQYPEQDMDMISRQRGWAEQQPEVWWQDFCTATQHLLDQFDIQPHRIKGIGIAYQMHGLVLIDKEQQVLRPSIIWCDSRAVAIGQKAFNDLGENYCLGSLLNSPGNFTASKLRWVKDNEPEVYEKADKILMPGDFIAMKLTGEATTTISGLSEGIFWDFKEKKIADKLLHYYGLEDQMIAPIVPTFSIQGKVTKKAAQRTGLAPGTPVAYRSGDQPNNALSLNVLHPGEMAATSGTSGVVYGIVDKPIFDKKSRVNSFAHVNYEDHFDRIGVLLCLNGAGIEYSWIKRQVARKDHTYDDMERMASTVPVGSDGLCLLPFGNGAERMLEDRNLNAHIFNLDFNRHTRAHLYRASLEGVAYSFVHGVNILKELGLNINIIRVGNDNMFQSKIFASTIATLLDCQIEVIETTGAIGAARAAGVATGIYGSISEAFGDIQNYAVYEPQLNLALCQQTYNYWQSRLQLVMEENSAGFRKTEAYLGEKTDHLKKELAQYSKALTLAQQKENAVNELLLQIKTAITGIKTDTPGTLSNISDRIEKWINSGNSVTDLSESLDLLHHDFLNKLNKAYPGLSRQELKLCHLLKMKLSTKELAHQLNMSIRGVETSRYRLRKKLGLQPSENLLAFLESIDSD
ncbi:MAG TPA: FGGY family carbohydrate kinase [Saprospiraceae bacterium]|nr:FGGY family carbohydrate kinase [Saprospiraceae bacterium]HMQ81880.1 FGGY family carbohydrate kinase [Saprospiraceae bacterium]